MDTVLGLHNIVPVTLGLHIESSIGIYTDLYIHYGDYIIET